MIHEPVVEPIDGRTKLLWHAPHVVCEFVGARIPHLLGGRFEPLAVAIGYLRDDHLAGGVVFTNHRKRPDGEIFDIEVSLAFDDPRWLRRGVLRRLFGYPFGQMDCRRVTSFTADDPAMNRFMARVGWVLEGRGVHGLDGTRDMLAYRMLREECRWIRD